MEVKIKNLIVIAALILGVGLASFLAGNRSARSEPASTDGVRGSIGSVQERNLELIRENERLVSELKSIRTDSEELGGIIESARVIAERSDAGFAKLADTLGSGSGTIADVITRQRAIAEIALELERENRLLNETLERYDRVGGAVGPEASGE